MHQYPLYVIADCSGSMAESGKARVLAYLLSHVAQCVRLQHLPNWCARVHAWAWAATVQPLALPVEHDLAPLRPEGRADATVLMAALESLLAEGSTPPRILLISDGGLDHVTQKRWQAWRARFPVDVRAVAVGADASRPALEALAGKGQVYEAEEVGIAIHDWESTQAAPLCITDTQSDAWQ